MGESVRVLGVLDKAVAVLDSLEAGPVSLQGLVERTGLPRATAHRIAATLEAHGLVRRDTEGRFALGAKLISLGRSAASSFPLAAAALPALTALRDATGESVQLYVRQGADRVCVAALESPHGLRTIVPLGATFPLSAGGSAARALLGEGDARWVETVGEREAGVASASAAVLDEDGAVVAAVSVSGPIGRTGGHPGERYGPSLLEAAQSIEAAVGTGARSPAPRG